MLKIVEWLIPEQTQDVMTPAEWMMFVLSIYFHNMRMLVTKDEFDNRGDSDFSAYNKDVRNLNKDLVEEIQKLLAPLDSFFRQDLAMVKLFRDIQRLTIFFNWK